MKQSHVRQRLVFLEQLAHMTHGHVRLVFLKLVILELIRYNLLWLWPLAKTFSPSANCLILWPGLQLWVVNISKVHPYFKSSPIISAWENKNGTTLFQPKVTAKMASMSRILKSCS